MPLFDDYAPEHAARLRARAERPAWRVAGLPDRPVQAPGSAPAQLSGAARYLVERNEPRVRELLGAGERDVDRLAAALADWQPTLAGEDAFPIIFLGLVLTLDCSFSPRCLYCNQARVPAVLGLDDWKELVAEAARPVPPYVYLTGGEPLVLGEQVWGAGGLVRFAAELGCAVNVNTNAALLTPEAALGLVAAGCARLHISLDSADACIQGELFGAAERVDEVWDGIHNVQVARALLGVRHPVIHINCVLTRRNLFGFPDLLRALLSRRARVDDPGDFAFHLIPVGGEANASIRPTADEWRRFYTETWQEAEDVWQGHQAAAGVADADRQSLTAHVPFASPWHRVNHHMDLDEYCALAGAGRYWQGAVGDRCHLAPSQAYVLPDGSQHWCGGHAVRRPEPMGRLPGAGLRANIRAAAAAGRLADLPIEACAGCAGATCVINQAMEAELASRVTEWVREADDGVVTGV